MTNQAQQGTAGALPHGQREGAPTQTDTPQNESLIIIPDDFSANSLALISEQAAGYSAEITDKKGFLSLYDFYQHVRRFRLAIQSKSKQLIAANKKAFEEGKKVIQDEEKKILLTVEPIEKKLLETRTAWETKIEEEKQKKADELAEAAEIEFERQEAIRIKQEIADIWAPAHEMNAAHDQKILDDLALIAETARLKKERDDFEQEKIDYERSKDRVDFDVAWMAAQAEQDARELAGKLPAQVDQYKDSFNEEPVDLSKNWFDDKPEVVDDLMESLEEKTEFDLSDEVIKNKTSLIFGEKEPAPSIPEDAPEPSFTCTECGELVFICPECGHPEDN